MDIIRRFCLLDPETTKLSIGHKFPLQRLEEKEGHLPSGSGGMEQEISEGKLLVFSLALT